MSETQKNPLAELAKAYTRAWAEVQNVVKNAHNPHFGSNYADLGAVIDTVKEVFAKWGLALLQSPGKITEVGGVLVMNLAGVLMHESGQNIPMEMSLPLGTLPKPEPEPPGGDWKAKKKGGNDITAQKAGGVITYGRRYQLASVAGIAQVDDDGNEASDRPSREVKVDYSELEKEIAAATDLETLDGTGKGKKFVKSSLRTRIEETGDKALADKFIARRSELKEAKKEQA